MRTRLLATVFGLFLSGCVHEHCSGFMSLFGCTEQVERPTRDDPTLVFPSFDAQAAVHVGTPESLSEFDGKILRALQLAADDFLPPGNKSRPCWETQAAHTYRVIRRGDILFVRIDENPASCGRELPALHSGARYAISLDGHILRRLVDGEPDGTASEVLRSSSPGVQAEPGTLPGDDAPPPEAP